MVGTRDNPRPGRPRVMPRQQDTYLGIMHLRNRFQSASLTARMIPDLQPVHPQTVRNRLRQYGIVARRPALRPVLTPRHCQARLQWCEIHVRFTRRQ